MLAAAGAAVALAVADGDHPRRAGESGSQRSLDGTAFAMMVPRGWSVDPRPPVLAGMTPRAPVALVNRDQGVHVVADRLPATSRTLLPAAFVRGLPDAATTPDTVRIGAGLRAWHYPGLTQPGVAGLVDVYVVPTTRGVVTVACLADAASSLLAECWRAVSGLRLRGSQQVSPGPAAAFRAAVLPAIERLQEQRSTAQREIALATTTQEQEAAVATMPAAFRETAAALGALAVGALPASAEVPRALREAAAAWAALGRRLRRPGLTGVARAQTRLTARELRLRQALDRVLVRAGD